MAKPINFRPNTTDREVMDLIRSHYPLTANTDAAIIRKAFEDYFYIHGPNAQTSKSARLDRHESILMLICEKLDIDISLVE